MRTSPAVEGHRPARRTRRTTAELRAQVLTTAGEVFAERGFDAATTREIATRAGVAEPLIFRHFGSKASLFDEAVLTPFREFADTYGRRVERELAQLDRRGAPKADLARAFVEGLYDCVDAQRPLLQAMVRSGWVLDGPDTSDRDAALAGLFADFRRIASSGIDRIGLRSRDVDFVVRFAFGLVFSTVVLDDWVFAGARRPSRARLIEELTAFVLYGTIQPAHHTDDQMQHAQGAR